MRTLPYALCLLVTRSAVSELLTWPLWEAALSEYSVYVLSLLFSSAQTPFISTLAYFTFFLCLNLLVRMFHTFVLQLYFIVKSLYIVIRPK